MLIKKVLHRKGERFKRVEFKYSASTVESGRYQADVSLVSWMDSKKVHCLTDLKTELMIVQRNSKDKNTGSYQQINVSMPSIFKIYSKFMGGN